MFQWWSAICICEAIPLQIIRGRLYMGNVPFHLWQICWPHSSVEWRPLFMPQASVYKNITQPLQEAASFICALLHVGSSSGCMSFLYYQALFSFLLLCSLSCQCVSCLCIVFTSQAWILLFCMLQCEAATATLRQKAGIAACLDMNSIQNWNW